MFKALKKVGAFSILFAATYAHASLLTFDLNHNFGTVDAGGDVLVNITEAATAGDVHISISNMTHGFLNGIYFNYSPNADIAGGSVYNFLAPTGIQGSPTVQYNGMQGFSIVFDFPNQPGLNFTGGQSVSFDLTANADLLVSGFNTLGTSGFGSQYYVMAHINAVTGNGSCSDGSAKIGDINGANVAGGALSDTCGTVPPSEVPEPASALLLGLGLAGLAYARRKAA